MDPKTTDIKAICFRINNLSPRIGPRELRAEATTSITDGAVKIDEANVVKTDTVGKNGVIHVIDTVIMAK